MATEETKRLDQIMVLFLMDKDINVSVGNEDGSKVCRDVELGTVLFQARVGSFRSEFIKWTNLNGYDYGDWCNKRNIAPF